MDILLSGLSKSGKSSIKRVVFEKMSPHESVFLETTTKIDSYELENIGYTNLIVRDYPHDYKFNKNNLPPHEVNYLKQCGVLIYVIDCQEITDNTFDYLKDVVNAAISKNPKVIVEIFFHKSDSSYFNQSSSSNKQYQEITSRINSILNEFNLEKSPAFYKTSIYDHSLFEAFSKIFQKLMPQNRVFSKLLDNLSDMCRFEKSYLFDVYNKIYIAIDSAPQVEDQLYEICTDMIDVVLDMSGIYGESMNNNNGNGNDGNFFDETSHSLIKINNVNTGDNSKNLLYLRFIDNNLALICIIKDENFERQHLIDHNIKLFRDALKEIFEVFSK